MDSTLCCPGHGQMAVAFVNPAATALQADRHKSGHHLPYHNQELGMRFQNLMTTTKRPLIRIVPA